MSAQVACAFNGHPTCEEKQDVLQRILDTHGDDFSTYEVLPRIRHMHGELLLTDLVEFEYEYGPDVCPTKVRVMRDCRWLVDYTLRSTPDRLPDGFTLVPQTTDA